MPRRSRSNNLIRQDGSIYANLPDDLLMRILIQLPQKYAVQCKIVCKHWLSLISTSKFVELSIHAHHQYFNGSSIWIRYYQDTNGSKSVSGELRINPWNHSVEDRNCNSAAAGVAYFDDLILFATPVYYSIWNRQTRAEYYTLRPVPPTPDETFTGFVCYPHKCRAEMASCTNTTNARYSYKVVRVHHSDENGLDTGVKIDVFCSESDEWSQLVVSSPPPLYEQQNTILAYKGILHWMAEDGRVVTYDHSNNRESCRIIDLPDNSVNVLGNPFPRIGVSGESMQLSQLRTSTSDVSIWKLEDYNAGKWGSERKILLRDTVSDDSWLTQTVAKSHVVANVMGFHPDDVDTLYLSFMGGCIASCNIRTKSLQLIEHIEGLRWMSGFVISSQHHWWSTPVPKPQLKH